MSDSELPADLAALERRLADRPRVAPSTGLGPRVLDVARLAQRPRPVAASWRSWAALAAAVLVGINLSMSVAGSADWRLTAGIEPGQIDATADRLRAAAPELPERELRRQALLYRAGAGLTPTVDLNPYREPERWDVR
ncbi:MAG TPA: hypothetical protein VFG68_15820 [Fimbriiglobus sp.]|nr:hypothetical protein [Fimbriiglobus sp.]